MNHAHRKNPYKYYLVFILVILLKRQAMHRGLKEVCQVHSYYLARKNGPIGILHCNKKKTKETSK